MPRFGGQLLGDCARQIGWSKLIQGQFRHENTE